MQDDGRRVHEIRAAVNPSTEALVSGARAGVPGAWERIVERHARLLWSIARRYRLDDADAADVVQMTWVRLFENIGSLRSPERLAAWLATTARHEALRTIARNGRSTPSGLAESLDQVDEHQPELDASLIRDEEIEWLRGAQRTLSTERQQLLALLTGPEPPSYQEISATLAIPVGSIGPTRLRCVQHLRLLADVVAE